LTLAFIAKLVFEFSIYFYPEFFLNAFRDFLKYETYRSIEVNLTRQRTYVDLLGESFIPLGFYYLFQLRNNIYRLASAIIVIGQVVISFLSNWRGRFINAIFVLLMVFISTYRARANNLKLILATLIVIFPILFLADKFVVSNNGFSVLDRLANKSHVEDEQPVQWRLASAEEAVLMANTHLFGVGLGNYYEHTTLKATDASLLTEEKRDLYDAAAVSGPHNFFAQYLAEGGYITLIFILLWLFYYLIQDIKVILSKNTTPEYITLSICFWGLIFGTQVYPATTLSFYVAFFALRSVLQRS
jgi:O-antigen ligase